MPNLVYENPYSVWVWYVQPGEQSAERYFTAENCEPCISSYGWQKMRSSNCLGAVCGTEVKDEYACIDICSPHDYQPVGNCSGDEPETGIQFCECTDENWIEVDT